MIMATIDEGFQTNSASAYVFAMVQLLLLIFAIGTICRCLLILLKGLTEEKELGEMVKVLQNRIMAAILAVSVSGIIEIIERAFK